MLDKRDIRSVKTEKKLNCWVCDLGIQVGDHAVEVVIHPTRFLTFRYQSHKTCTADLRDLLDERLTQAGKGEITT
jgi:hypothetical protein